MRSMRASARRLGGEVFLEEMELVFPWKALLSVISRHYPVDGRGRRP